jgi:hypothetical protein
VFNEFVKVWNDEADARSFLATTDIDVVQLAVANEATHLIRRDAEIFRALVNRQTYRLDVRRADRLGMRRVQISPARIFFAAIAFERRNLAIG